VPYFAKMPSAFSHPYYAANGGDPYFPPTILPELMAGDPYQIGDFIGTIRRQALIAAGDPGYQIYSYWVLAGKIYQRFSCDDHQFVDMANLFRPYLYSTEIPNFLHLVEAQHWTGTHWHTYQSGLNPQFGANGRADVLINRPDIVNNNLPRLSWRYDFIATSTSQLIATYYSEDRQATASGYVRAKAYLDGVDPNIPETWEYELISSCSRVAIVIDCVIGQRYSGFLHNVEPFSLKLAGDNQSPFYDSLVNNIIIPPFQPSIPATSLAKSYLFPDAIADWFADLLAEQAALPINQEPALNSYIPPPTVYPIKRAVAVNLPVVGWRHIIIPANNNIWQKQLPTLSFGAQLPAAAIPSIGEIDNLYYSFDPQGTPTKYDMPIPPQLLEIHASLKAGIYVNANNLGDKINALNLSPLTTAVEGIKTDTTALLARPTGGDTSALTAAIASIQADTTALLARPTGGDVGEIATKIDAIDAATSRINQALNVNAVYDKPYNLYQRIDRIANILGLHFDDSGNPLEAPKIITGREVTITDSNNFRRGQWGTRGMLLNSVPNRFDGNNIVPGGFAQVHDLPQLIAELISQQNTALGVQQFGAYKVPAGQSDKLNFTGLSAGIMHISDLLNQFSQRLQNLQISAIQTNNNVASTINGLGLQTNIATEPIVVDGTVAQIPYYSIDPSDSLSNRIGEILSNQQGVGDGF
jgi:hypothetical protein